MDVRRQTPTSGPDEARAVTRIFLVSLGSRLKYDDRRIAKWHILEAWKPETQVC